MDEQDAEVGGQIEQAEREAALQQEVSTIIATDLPRIVRSDVTTLSEMIMKYTGMGSLAVVSVLVAARRTLLEFSAETAGFAAPTMAGPGADPAQSADPPPAAKEPWDKPAPMKPQRAAQRGNSGLTYKSDGKDVLLTTLLTQLGFVSSSGRAKVGIREGLVFVNDSKITNDGALLQPGEYDVKVGDGDAQQVTII